jgi:hypothetical protein
MFVEQLVPVLPEKPEQRSHASETLHEQLLLLRQLHRGRPSIHRAPLQRTRSWQRAAVDRLIALCTHVIEFYLEINAIDALALPSRAFFRVGCM